MEGGEFRTTGDGPSRATTLRSEKSRAKLAKENRSLTFGSGTNGSRSADRSTDDGFSRSDTIRTLGRLKLRGQFDDLPQDWWFASTAIPLLAATIGPLANVLSIAALVTTWRVALKDNGTMPEGTDDKGVGIPDPHWEVALNAVSLACGFFGNFCLLLNFTRRIRYIVALPLSIISWYFATFIVSLYSYLPPVVAMIDEFYYFFGSACYL